MRACDSTKPAPALSVANGDAIALDDDGQVLVIGQTDETVEVSVVGGPRFSARRIAWNDNLGVYDVPVLRGIGCTGDDAPLPHPAPGAETVGAALTTLGVQRIPAAAPAPRQSPGAAPDGALSLEESGVLDDRGKRASHNARGNATAALVGLGGLGTLLVLAALMVMQ